MGNVLDMAQMGFQDVATSKRPSNSFHQVQGARVQEPAAAADTPSFVRYRAESTHVGAGTGATGNSNCS
jgi:hypothetical protein